MYALNLREGTIWLEATVREKIGINMYKVTVSNSDVIWTRHVEQLLPRKQSRDDETQGNIYVDECLRESLRRESVMRESMQSENASGNISVSEKNERGDDQTTSVNESPVTYLSNENKSEPRRSNRTRRSVDRYVAGNNSSIAW